MTFTKSDGVTFLVGLGVSLAFTLGAALSGVTDGTDLGTWAYSTGIGLAVAAGRYLTTRATEWMILLGLKSVGDE